MVPILLLTLSYGNYMRTSNFAKVLLRDLDISTYYFEINPQDDGNTSVQMVWTGGIGTITFEGSNFSRTEVATDAVSSKWVAVPLPSVAISGAGSALVSWGNGSVFRIRVKVVVTTAVTGFELRAWGVE